MHEIESLLQTYAAGINEPDDARRLAIFEQVLTDDMTFFPGTSSSEAPAHTRTEFSTAIGELRAYLPEGAGIAITSGVDGHHGWIRFGWEFRTADGVLIPSRQGVDIAHVSDDGRLDEVIVFTGLQPPATGAELI